MSKKLWLYACSPSPETPQRGVVFGTILFKMAPSLLCPSLTLAIHEINISWPPTFVSSLAPPPSSWLSITKTHGLSLKIEWGQVESWVRLTGYGGGPSRSQVLRTVVMRRVPHLQCPCFARDFGLHFSLGSLRLSVRSLMGTKIKLCHTEGGVEVGQI